MDELWVLFIIIMMVASFIEKAAKAGKQRPGQPPRRPPARRPGLEQPEAAARPRLPSAPPEAARPGPAAGGGRASEMIDEDFWRELTGLPPLRRQPVPPAPAEADSEAVESWDEEAVRQVEAAPPETVRERSSASWDYRRPEVVHEPPVVVSLETTPAAPAARHAAYHKRLEASAALAPTPRAPRENPLLRRLRKGEGLRESVVLAEVFGRPRGLEEYSPDR